MVGDAHARRHLFLADLANVRAIATHWEPKPRLAATAEARCSLLLPCDSTIEAIAPLSRDQSNSRDLKRGAFMRYFANAYIDSEITSKLIFSEENPAALQLLDVLREDAERYAAKAKDIDENLPFLCVRSGVGQRAGCC